MERKNLVAIIPWVYLKAPRKPNISFVALIRLGASFSNQIHKHTHTHTHTYIYNFFKAFYDYFHLFPVPSRRLVWNKGTSYTIQIHTYILYATKKKLRNKSFVKEMMDINLLLEGITLYFSAIKLSLKQVIKA